MLNACDATKVAATLAEATSAGAAVWASNVGPIEPEIASATSTLWDDIPEFDPSGHHGSTETLVAEMATQPSYPQEFLNRGHAIADESLEFHVDRNELARLINAIVAAASTHKEIADVRVAVSQSDLEFTTGWLQSGLFVELRLPLVHNPVSWPTSSWKLSFGLDLGKLHKYLKVTTAAEVVFATDGEQLKIKDPKGYVSLKLKPSHKPPSYTHDVAEAPFVCVEALVHALDYMKLLARTEHLPSTLGVITIRDGSVVGGHYDEVGIFQSGTLSALKLSLPVKTMLGLRPLLQIMNASKPSVRQVSGQLIIANESVCVVCAAATCEFPKTSKFLELPELDRILVERQVLLKWLRKFDAVSSGGPYESLVEIQLNGFGADGCMKIRVRDQTGKSINFAEIGCYRTTKPSTAPDPTTTEPVLESVVGADGAIYTVSLAKFRRVIEHFQSPNAEIFSVRANKNGDRLLKIVDEGDGDNVTYNTSTIMYCLDQNAIKKVAIKNKKSLEQVH